ncbi:MBL fold metallo-hydrolase [Chloroflexota bacterium]
MQIKVLASGSKGNAYLVDDGKTPLLIECGIPFKALQRKLWDAGYKLSDLSGCLVSHAHDDHSRAVKDLLKAGVDCYMSILTARELRVANHHRVKIDNGLNYWIINKWFINYFLAVHDVPCFGFIISSGNERLLYMSDSAYSPYRFPGLTRIMIGCNYSLDILNDNIEKGIVPREQKSRLLHSHASLETVKELLLANDLSKLKEIWLIHLSDRNADEERFKREVAEIVGVPVYVS